VATGILLANCLPLVAQELAPVPADAAQQVAVKLIEEVYGKEHARAKTSTAKTAIANKLLKEAAASEDLTNRYVLLRVARDMATQAGDAETAVRAVEEIGKSFQVDVFQLKGAALSQARKSASLTKQRKALAEQALALIEEAVDRADFVAAKYLGQLALDSARKAREGVLTKRIVARNKMATEAEEAYSAAKDALQTLEESPADPKANLTAGAYLCFMKGDWDKGIPMLALGTDGQTTELAIKELEGVTDVTGQVAMGDGWWALSETRDGLAKERIRQRAAAWYRLVQERASRLVKLKIQKRLQGIKEPSKPMVLISRARPAVVAPSSTEPPILTVTELHRFGDLTSQVVKVEFSPDGRLLAATGLGKAAFLIDVQTYKIVRKLQGHTDDARVVAFSPDGREIATGAEDRTVKLWDSSTGKLKETFLGHTGLLMDVTYAPNGRTLASAAVDRTIRLWSLDDSSKHSVLTGHTSWVSCVAFSPDGKRLASAGGSDRTVRIWDLQTGQTKSILNGHLAKVRKVQFLSDGKTLLSGSDDKTIRIWDTRSGKQLHVIETPSSVTSMEVLRPAERIVVSAGSDDLIRFWDIKTQKLVTTAEDLPTQLRWAMAASPDGRLVAVGGAKGMLRLYSLSAQ